MTIERNLVSQLRKDGHQDKTILAICKNEKVGLDMHEVTSILNEPYNRTRTATKPKDVEAPEGVDSSTYFLG